MSCAQCDSLREEIAYLKGELGLHQTAEEIHALKQALDLRPGQAGVLLALYRAGGRTRSRLQLLDAIPSSREEDRADTGIDVRLVGVRKALGKDAIETIRSAGFRLTPIGLARVSEILGGGQ